MYVGLMGAIRIAITVIILVFFILGLLALLMVALREIIKITSKKRTEEVKKISNLQREEAITKLSTKEEEEDQKREDQHDERIIAVISAAVSSFMERPMQQIKIIRIVRDIPAGVSPWAISGKQNMMSERISISSRKKGGF